MSGTYRYLPTGCIPKMPKISKHNLREKLGLQDSFVVNYIGRHTLAIYLLQDIFIKVFLEILGFECQGILFSLIVLLCSCLACWIFEKTKIIKYIISL